MKTLLSVQEEFDRELVSALRQGKPRAEEALIRYHGPKMMSIVSRFLHDEQERREAVMEAFAMAFDRIGAGGPEADLAGWLHGITLRVCLARLAPAVPAADSSIEQLLPRFDETGHRVGGDTSAPGVIPRPGDPRAGRKLRSCIDRLPLPHRVVLLLRDGEGLDESTTAWLLDCTEAGVRTRLHQARQALMTLMGATA